MSTTNLILILLKLFFSCPLKIKQPIKVQHYDFSPKHITNIQYYKLNKIGERKILQPADFKILLAQVQIFSQIRTLQVRAYAIHAKLCGKENFCHKIALRRGFRFDHDNWYVNNMERPFFPTEIEARRELARVGLVSKHHYCPQMIHFDVLDNLRWQANIEEKQGCFRLDRYRPFAFQHGSMVYNPR